MLLIRRLYVYLICGISLLILAMAMRQLLDLAVLQPWDSFGGSRLIDDTGDDVRRVVSLNLALVAVSLPIWALHWYLAERWSVSTDDESDRGSGVRSIYFAAVLGFAAIVFVGNIYPIIDSAFSSLFDSTTSTGARDLIGSAVGIVVTLTVWGYHAWIRERDQRIQVMSGAGIWPVRLYLYSVAFAGGVLALSGLAELMYLAMDALVDRQDLLIGGGSRASSVSAALTRLIVGGAFWGTHWAYSLRLIDRSDWRTTSERQSLLRWSYLYLSVIVGVFGALVSVIVSLTEAFRWLFGVEPGVGAGPLWARVLTPLVVAVPFLLSWVYHQRMIRLEAAQLPDRPAQASVNRVYVYSVALVALAFTAVGLGYLLGVLIEFAFESARILDTDPEWVPSQVSVFLSIATVGGSVWIWYWATAQRRLSSVAGQERVSTSRRVYIYLVLTATTLSVLGTLAYILYQGLQLLLGVRSTTGLASDVGVLLGVLIVAGGLLVYHLLILRDDLRQRPATSVSEPPLDQEPFAPRRSLLLTLSGPESADFGAVIGEIRSRLPEAFELQSDEDPSQETTPATAPETSEPNEPLSPADDGRQDRDPETRIFT